MSISHIQIKSLEILLAKRQDLLANNVLPVGLPDAAAYYYFKEGSFLSKKQERWTTFLFQGLNTNPQNLSIYLRDDAERQNKSNKEKLIKGVFMIFDLFSKCDMVIEINIPGNLRIYKLINNKKQLVSNEEIDLMYLSSIFRSMYQINLPWGRFYHIFHDSKNFLQELRSFYSILFKSLAKKDINIGQQFESMSNIKGSHACSLVLNYIKDRKLVQVSIQMIQQLLKNNKEYQGCPKYYILLAQLYLQFGKTSKCLEIMSVQVEKYNRDPYLIYYQSKYLYHHSSFEKALVLCNSIVQYNQIQIWILLAQIHLELKHFGDLLICLNHSIKISKIKSVKNLDIVYKSFEDLGKIKSVGLVDGIQHYPKLLIPSETPLNILVKQVEQKNKFLLEKGYWKLNSYQKMIYNIVRELRYKLQMKKFQQLLVSTFQDNIAKYEPIVIKKGLTQSLFVQQPVNNKSPLENEKSHRLEEQFQEELPDFLKNSIDKVQQSYVGKPSRNLSIIQQIQSVIENSNYEERQKDRARKGIKHKRQVNEGLFKIIKLVLGENDFEKAQYENNMAKILTVYNKMRTSSKYNNYYADRMFRIFLQTVNYKSIVVLIAQTLDFLEQKGVKKIDKLPYWMHKYLFFIIEEKGLKYLNDLLQKLNYYDQAIIDTIEIAKKWKMKGVTY